jgi:hypothetical protein
MSQLNQILERIADIQITIEVPGLGIPVVLRSDPYQPSQVASVNCPLWINEIRGGPSDIPMGEGQQYRVTTVQMFLCVARRDGNIDLSYNVEICAAWADAVFAEFAKHRKLSAPQVKIVSSTNTNPIQITTGTPHTLANPSDQVTIAGHLLNTPANGNWNTTWISPTQFSIPVAGIAVGVNTGTARMLQPGDLVSFVNSSTIIRWDVVDYMYGDTTFVALRFENRIDEIYQQLTEM